MPGQFEIVLSRQAIKYYKRLPLNLARRIDRVFIILEENPFFGADIKLLTRKPLRYRLRVGDLRIIYQIDKVKKLVLISAILPRGEAYKK